MTKEEWISRAAEEYQRHGFANPREMAVALFFDHDDGGDWNLSADYDPEECVREDIG